MAAINHVEATENVGTAQAIDKALAAGEPVQMRSTLDDLPMLKALRMYWRISLICMLGAFCAALDGYRTSNWNPKSKIVQVKAANLLVLLPQRQRFPSLVR